MPATPERTVSREDAKAVAALREADPVLRDVIDQIGTDGLGDFRHYLPSDSYSTLIRAIAGQQLSNATTNSWSSSPNE